VLPRDSSPQAGHYAGHWVPAPPTGPLSPSFSVCVDVLGDDGFAHVASWCEASTADRSAGRRTPRTERRTLDRPTSHPPEATHRAAGATPPARSLPTTSADRLPYETEWSRSLLAQGFETILPCQRLLQPSTGLACLGQSSYPGRCDRLSSDSRERYVRQKQRRQSRSASEWVTVRSY
jgi:hypothetical protein